MVIYGLLWSFYGLLWQNIDSIGFVLSFLTVIDPNSFGLVLYTITVRKRFILYCLKELGEIWQENFTLSKTLVSNHLLFNTINQISEISQT